ncbi:deoxyribose-phosphate aldolase [Hydrogenoanaerobacterium saccharovorans]|uniref:Deoxyribose-phosphate aldolase n=1 Tax=Hydrogenoanaerobacterium saccharovorans TaxID=474960 RepID=A0ABS2GNW8_9FIRM|nr:deoxyribose-phosphate aldolase [Hydrogenoanaerobacterium saccharovorans]MBM6923180.1 deoxyribose-phosphate aldolase [Hydrogenoanaerobacterium saccharovorans]MBS5634498.1 deoxyribose-phosphate aldolase [Clostridiales bacterium]
MTNQELFSYVDHTLLKPEATPEQIAALCAEAAEHGTASVCVNGSYVALAKKLLDGKAKVCAVIGFPLGAMSTAAKAFEAAEAIRDGADEIDMVIHIGQLKAGNTDYVLEDIKAVKAAIGDHILKVIIETCLLTEEEKITMCRLVTESGAEYIKTSTGFSTGGATFDDVRLFAEHVGEGVKIKAAGGIRSREDMEEFLRLGASRLGTSSAVKILCGKN